MKKKISFCFLLAFALSVAIIQADLLTAFAGIPPYNPIYEIALLDNGDSLSIQSQTMTFIPPSELKAMPYAPDLPKTLRSEYIVNNAGQQASSRIAVPILGSITDDYDGYSFSVNGTKLEPKKYYTFRQYWYEAVDFTQDIFEGTFSEPVYYPEDLYGTLYEITSAPATLELFFELQPNQKIVFDGFSTYSYRVQNSKGNSEIILSSPFGTRQTIFVTSGTLNCEYAGANITSTTITYNDYLAPFNIPEFGTEFFMYCTNSFDNYLRNGGRIIRDSELFEYMGNWRMIYLVYTVDFKEGLNMLTLDRPIKYSYYSDYEPYIWYFEFNNAPLKTWANVGAVKIDITVQDDLPYVIKDKFAFIDKGQKQFTYEGNLSSYDTYEIHFCKVKNPVLKGSGTPSKPLTTIQIVFICIGSVALVWLIISLAFLFRSFRNLKKEK